MAVNAKNWQELKKPNTLEKKLAGGDSRRRAVFVAEPLERGFGMTLGNSLPRGLLLTRPRQPPPPSAAEPPSGRRRPVDQDRRRPSRVLEPRRRPRGRHRH